MKRIALAGLIFLLLVSGLALAEQSGEQKKRHSMPGMMQGMMTEGKPGEGGMHGISGMGGMMRMMKMMDQCSAMMEQCCPATDTGKIEEEQKK